MNIASLVQKLSAILSFHVLVRCLCNTYTRFQHRHQCPSAFVFRSGDGTLRLRNGAVNTQKLDYLSEPTLFALEECVHFSALGAVLMEELDDLKVVGDRRVVHRLCREPEEFVRVEELDEIQKAVGRRHIHEALPGSKLKALRQ